jgi:hypothetical protein
MHTAFRWRTQRLIAQNFRPSKTSLLPRSLQSLFQSLTIREASMPLAWKCAKACIHSANAKVRRMLLRASLLCVMSSVCAELASSIATGALDMEANSVGHVPVSTCLEKAAQTTKWIIRIRKQPEEKNVFQNLPNQFCPGLNCAHACSMLFVYVSGAQPLVGT